MQFFFLRIAENGTINYLPIVLQIIFAIGFVATMIIASSRFGPKRQTSDKLVNFESGIEIQGNARQPMAIKYFLVAILFVLFDVEVIFFYPYAVNFRELGWHGFVESVPFSFAPTPIFISVTLWPCAFGSPLKVSYTDGPSFFPK